MTRTHASAARPASLAALGVAALALLASGGALAADPDEAEAQRLRELTQVSSWVEFGTYITSDDSFKFGDFTGLDDEGFNLLGNFDLQGRAPWDSGQTWHWRALGGNLGLDSRFVNLEYGQQGLFDVWFEYEQLPKLRIDTAQTIFGGRGTGLLTLPPGWVAGANTAGFAALDATLQGLNVQHRRRDLRSGFDLVLPGAWELSADYEYETKDGRKVTAALIGNTGGNPRAVLVPEPVDYRTNELDLALRYGGERGQLELAYQLSHFKSVDDALTWDIPWSGNGGWSPVVTFANGAQGRKATPPDNQFQQVSLSGGYNLPLNTRITSSAALGWMRQSESFLPYTVNPDLSVTAPLPRSDLDGKIDTTALSLNVASRPLPKLRINAGYRYDDRDNNTPRELYFVVPGDSLDQDTDPVSGRARLNHPYSYQLKEAKLEVGYEILKRTEFWIGYEYEEIERTFSEVDETQEDIYRIGLRSQPLRTVGLRIEASHGKRYGSSYFGNAQFFSGFTPEHLLDEGCPDDLACFENIPGLRKFLFADRDRDQIGGALTWTPLDQLSLGFRVDHVAEDYDDDPTGVEGAVINPPGGGGAAEQFGLTFRESTLYGLDVSWAPTDYLTTYGYYTFEDFKSRQRGRSFRGFAKLAEAGSAAQDWVTRDTDSVDTFGLGTEWRLLGERLRLRADYAYAKAKGTIDVSTALDAPVPFPDTSSRLHNVSLQAQYKLRPELSVRLGYLFERLEVDDWALDGIEPDTLANVLTLGNLSPDYDAHLIAVSLIYEWW